MRAFKTFSVTAFACLAILSSCGSDNEGNKPKNEYDRQAMLANYADNLIVPAYSQLQTKAAAMHTAIDAFVAAPGIATLATARTAYQQAYLSWQDVSMYGFGPADEQLLVANFNNYPVTTSQIEGNISSGSYDLQTTANLSAKGFPALDYLLYQAGSEAAVVEAYTTDARATNRKKYLLEISQLLVQRTQAVYNSWTSGDYAATFKSSPGTAVGSAVGNLVNSLNADIDITKRYKVGTPAGKFTSGQALPEKVEAYYSHMSMALLQQNIRAEKALFMGRAANGTNGPGLDDYLDHVQAAYQGGLLSDAIEAQFDEALAAAEAVQGSLSEAAATQPQAVLKVYDALQKLIVLTKTDMPATLGVTISYTDNDGD